MISVKNIQRALYQNVGDHMILLNAYVFSTGWESDFAYFTESGYGYEIEIKRSYEDFKADFKKSPYQNPNTKTKHQYIEMKTEKQNYFSFCFESKELALRCLPEVSEIYGVCFATSYMKEPSPYGDTIGGERVMITWIRGPQKIHSNKMEWSAIAKRISRSYKTKMFPVRDGYLIWD